MRKILLAFLLSASLLAPTAAFAQTAVSVKITPAERKAAEAITAAQISSYLHFIASDAMGGRDTHFDGQVADECHNEQQRREHRQKEVEGQLGREARSIIVQCVDQRPAREFAPGEWNTKVREHVSA